MMTETKKSAELEAKNKADAIKDYNNYLAKMPELKQQVEYLGKLSKKATYTMAGVAKDSITRQLGMPVLCYN